MRLTKKQNNKLYPYIYSGIDDIFQGTPINKLGRLEDIEDEFCIDLLILHKAISCGVFMLTKNFGVIYCEHPKLVHYKSGWKMLICGSNLSLSSYGKLWALTKEELL